MSGTVLVVQSDDAKAESLRATLVERGWTVSSCHDVAGALEAAARDRPAVILTDLHLGDDDGLLLCRRAAERWPRVPVVALTARGSLELAVEALRASAFDFLAVPVDPDVLHLTLERALEHHTLLEEVRQLRRKVRLSSHMGELLGDSKPMRELYDLLQRVAPVPSSVLITGESGTGKELVARALHDHSGRSQRPFVAINCAAMPEPLLESELFGHVRGAFTDAREDRTGLMVTADGGTLFLDEIGDMPLGLQAKLLRVLQERRVRPVGGAQEVGIDVRVVAATHQDLEDASSAGRFRQDLLYRLDVIRIELPPLRARGADVLLLAQRFLDERAARFDKPARGFTPAALRMLAEYPWPGNVRELQNCIERAVVLSSSDEVTVEDLPPRIRRSVPHDTAARAVVDDPRVLPTLAEVEEQHIHRVLAACSGNRSEAAAVLAVDRKTLYRKLEAYKATASDAGTGR